MAANKVIRFGPVILSATLTTNIINSTITSLAGPVGYTQTQPYLILRHLRISNKTGSAATFSLWIGASAGNVAGTEFEGTAISVAANTAYDWYGNLRLDAADFLVGGAGTGSALTLEGEGEIGLV
jgi:hypothetical protein